MREYSLGIALPEIETEESLDNGNTVCGMKMHVQISKQRVSRDERREQRGRRSKERERERDRAKARERDSTRPGSLG